MEKIPGRGNKKMKTLIVYVSIHHGNTKKLAEAMAEVLDGELIRPSEVGINKLSDYDLIGFGSGIYFGKHHKNLLNLVDNLPKLDGKKAFIFSSSGMKEGGLFNKFHKAIKEKLREKGVNVIGEFSCLGFDTYGPLKLIGGISKGRPNEKDLENARVFARNLRNI